MRSPSLHAVRDRPRRRNPTRALGGGVGPGPDGGGHIRGGTTVTLIGEGFLSLEEAAGTTSLRVRFGDRLTIACQVPPTLLTAAVLDLTLQPLVENDVEHGIECNLRCISRSFNFATRGKRMERGLKSNIGTYTMLRS